MKKYLKPLAFILIVSACFTTNAQTQNKDIDKLMPEVKTAFSKKFPTTTVESWMKLDKAILVVFKSGDDYSDAFFDEKGAWLRTETSILYNQLPQAVRDSLKTGEFSTWEKGSVFKVELPADENYKIYVYSKDWNEMEVNFDKSGKRIQ